LQRSDELATGEINVKRFEEAVKSVEKTFRLGHKRGRDDDCEREPKKYHCPMYYEGPQPVGHMMEHMMGPPPPVTQ